MAYNEQVESNPPGKRIPLAFTPALFKFSTSLRHCVLLPDRSSPSKTMKAPRCEVEAVEPELGEPLLDECAMGWAALLVDDADMSDDRCAAIAARRGVVW